MGYRSVGMIPFVGPRSLFIAAAIGASSVACTLRPFAAADSGPGVDTGGDISTDATADSGLDASDERADVVSDGTPQDLPPANYRVVGDGGIVWHLPQLGGVAIEGPYGTGCPAGTVVGGAYFEWESIGWGNGGMPRVIQFYCSSINPDGTVNTAIPGPETATTNQPPAQFQGLMMGSDHCNAGEVVVGLYGTTVSGVMNQIGLQCASLVDWIRDPSTATVNSLPLHGAVNALNQTTNTPWERSCSLSTVPTALSRIDGEVGYWFETLRATCIEVER